MWEIDLIFDRTKYNYCTYFEQILAEKIKEPRVVTAIMADDDKIYFSIGCPDEMATQIREYVCHALADVICDKIKYDFLSKNLNFDCDNDIYNYAFIKVCTYFDIEMEREIILQNIDLTMPRMDVLSFVYFRLPQIIAKWRELCDIVMNSINVIKYKTNFCELFKFLLSNIDNKCQSVILEFKQKCLVYHDLDKNMDIVESIRGKDYISLIGRLIELNPAFIKVHSTKNDKMLPILKDMFADKIEIC